MATLILRSRGSRVALSRFGATILLTTVMAAIFARAEISTGAEPFYHGLPIDSSVDIAYSSRRHVHGMDDYLDIADFSMPGRIKPSREFQQRFRVNEWDLFGIELVTNDHDIEQMADNVDDSQIVWAREILGEIASDNIVVIAIGFRSEKPPYSLPLVQGAPVALHEFAWRVIGAIHSASSDSRRLIVCVEFGKAAGFRELAARLDVLLAAMQLTVARRSHFNIGGSHWKLEAFPNGIRREVSTRAARGFELLDRLDRYSAFGGKVDVSRKSPPQENADSPKQSRISPFMNGDWREELSKSIRDSARPVVRIRFPTADNPDTFDIGSERASADLVCLKFMGHLAIANRLHAQPAVYLERSRPSYNVEDEFASRDENILARIIALCVALDLPYLIRPCGLDERILQLQLALPFDGETHSATISELDHRDLVDFLSNGREATKIDELRDQKANAP